MFVGDRILDLETLKSVYDFVALGEFLFRELAILAHHYKKGPRQKVEQLGQIFIQLAQLVHLIPFSNFKFFELYWVPMAIFNENWNLVHKLLVMVNKGLFKVLADPVDVVHPLLELDFINLCLEIIPFNQPELTYLSVDLIHNFVKLISDSNNFL